MTVNPAQICSVRIADVRRGVYRVDTSLRHLKSRLTVVRANTRPTKASSISTRFISLKPATFPTPAVG